MYLARDVLDKEIVDRQGYKAGKVDGILLELTEAGEPPIVRAIVTQQGALARALGHSWARLSVWFQDWFLGLPPDTRPVNLGWEHIAAIDVVVHTDISRREFGMLRSEDAVWDRWIKPLPWADR